MADTLDIASPFADTLAPARHGNPDGLPGVTLARVVNVTQAEIALFGQISGGDMAGLGLGKSDKPKPAGRILFQTGPRRVFVVDRDKDILPALRKAVGANTGAVIDQSHGRVCLEMAGPRAADALMKLVAVDLDPSACAIGSGLATSHHGLSMLIWRAGSEKFLLFVHRSFARALARALIRAGEEYGLETL